MIQIADNILSVLAEAIMEGNALTLTGQLDRKTYDATNKVLVAAGGKWNKKAKAHLFDGPAAEVIEPIVLTGTYSNTKQDFGQFDTPTDVVSQMMDLILGEIAGKQCLEPSAGLGNIALAMADRGGFVDTYEIDPKRRKTLIGYVLKRRLRSAMHADFLDTYPDQIYDVVAMNPPFAGQADIKHVLHAFKFLKPGGRLVAIMSASVLFRDNSLTTGFRNTVAAHLGTITPLDDGAFKSSGTGVRTVLVSMVK